MKLSKLGFLPTKLVKEVYSRGSREDYFVTRGLAKVYKEAEGRSVHLTHILFNLTGMARKTKGKSQLTKKGVK